MTGKGETRLAIVQTVTCSVVVVVMVVIAVPLRRILTAAERSVFMLCFSKRWWNRAAEAQSTTPLFLFIISRRPVAECTSLCKKKKGFSEVRGISMAAAKRKSTYRSFRESALMSEMIAELVQGCTDPKRRKRRR